MFNWDASFYSESQILNNFLELPIFISLVFPKDQWNLTALFRTLRCFWIINLSWKLETFLLQVTSYKASFKQF